MDLSLQALVPHQLKLRFFDIEADIRADSRTYTDLFAQLYPRFRVNENSASDQSPVEFLVLSKPDNPWGKPVIILDKEVCPLIDSKLTEGFVYESILRDIIARVRSHFLIHAGVAARNGQGVLIVADSTHGKTTMVLELVRRGFKFLSDEIAALGRADGRVYPFPRSLRIRFGTLERVGLADLALAAPTPVWADKLSLDIEAIQPGSLGEPATISHIVILQNPAAAETNMSPSELEMGVYVDHLDEALLTAVRQIDGVTEVRPDTAFGFSLFWFRSTQKLSGLAQIEAICREHQVVILDTIKNRTLMSPTFDQPAQLEAIPTSQTVMGLVRQFLAGYQSRTLRDEFGGNSGHLFMELATLIGQANCYKLSVGPLNEMADLVCDLFDP